MRFALAFGAVILAVSAQYETENSGYGGNDQYAVQKAAKKSPYNKPVDYTNHGKPEYKPDPGYGKKPVIIPVKIVYSDAPAGKIDINKLIGNTVKTQTLGQASQQGQSNVQQGGAQTNVGSNSNSVNVGQTNYQQGGGNKGGHGSYPSPSYPAPSYPAPAYPAPQDAPTYNKPSYPSPSYPAPSYPAPSYPAPSYPAPSYPASSYNPTNIDVTKLIGNKIDTQTLGQANQQGQSSVQKGGDQTNVGSNSNEVNVGQTNYQQGGGTKGGHGGYPSPSYPAPSYPAPSYPAPAYDAPKYGGSVPNIDINKLIGNKITTQTLGQVNQQGQSNVQKGGDQTNVGSNTNEVNVGQSNYQQGGGNKGGHGSYPSPSYPAPSYPAPAYPAPQDAPTYNKPSYPSPSYPAPSYPAPSYPASSYNPTNIDVTKLIGNKIDTQTLAQANAQGQENVQKGGDQTNVGVNTNAVNAGQSNYQAGAAGNKGEYAPTYDAPGGYGQAYLILPNYNLNYLAGNKVNTQTLGQANQQGQSSVQKGGDQTNVGVNTNAVNVGQTNYQAGSGKGGHGGSYPAPPTYDAPKYGGSVPSVDINKLIGNTVKTQTLGQENTQGQSNAQIGGAQTNVGSNSNAVNVGQTNYQQGGGNKGKHGSYPAPSYPAPSYPAPKSSDYPSNYGGYKGGAGNINVNELLKNKITTQTLAQVNAQGQSNVQKGGDQTNVGVNTNEVNAGQSNVQSDASGYGRRRL